ncbi:hypothetical protein LWM68_02655 [Niabella sp. W65]|nr:hypothetical protein [Niabella sp. W65]MCH7361773.1 hypothetical protein [Niabella sp. W65]
MLHIQKFIAWDDDPYNAIGLGGGTWRPVNDDADGGGAGARLFQAQSKMNNMSDDELDEAPF